MQKNTAGKWIVYAYNTSTNLPVTGDAANITADVYIDGVLNAIDDLNPTELAGGYYSFDLTALETDGDSLLIVATSATGSVRVIGKPEALYTEITEAIQEQIGNIATGSSAISIIASGQLLTTGTQVNTYLDTATKNGVYHQISDAAGALEIYYEFDVGGNGVASEVSMWGRLFGVGDTVGVYAYNWAGASWDAIGVMAGKNQTTDDFASFNLLTRHTGIGANLGKVRVRGYAASGLTAATLYIDQAYVSFAVVFQSVGYAEGKIWIDTSAGIAGTEIYVNGVADNPVDTMADANIIDGILRLDRFEFSPDSSVTLTQEQSNQLLTGKGYLLDLNGQLLTGSTIIGGTISGSAITAGNEIHFVDCQIGSISLGAAHLHECGLTGTLTLTDAATYTLQTCHSEIAGAAKPSIDFGAVVGNTSLNMRRYSGGVEILNMGATGIDTMSLEGNGALVINANCVGGTIVVRGDFSIQDNSGGAVTITYDDNTANIIAIRTKADLLTFTKANELDSNIQSINGVTVTGDGSTTPFDV